MRALGNFLAALLIAVLPLGAVAQDTATTPSPTPAPAPAPAPATPERQSAAVLKSDGTPDYGEWNRLAIRVEQALQTGRVSDRVLALQRSDLVDWRQAFADAKSENAVRINTLKVQISTLGPPPGEGGSEPAVLTQRRNELTQDLNAARVPVQAAEEAFSRADALIGEIDALTRARVTDALFSLGPSPVNPVIWPAAWRDLTTTMRLALSGISKAWGTETQRAELKRELPAIILLTVFGAVLLVRGRAWVMRLGAGVYRRAEGPARGTLGFVISLGQVAAPLAGIVLLIEALNRAGVLDLRTQVMVDGLPMLGLSFFGALWLGGRTFGTRYSMNHAALALPDGHDARRGRLGFALMGLVVGLIDLLARIGAYENYGDVSQVVLTFPLIVLGALLLVQIGALLRRHAGAASDEGASFRSRLVALTGRVLLLLALVGVAAAAVGYSALGLRLIVPTILTLGLLAALEVAHIFITDLYGVLTRRDQKAAEEALLPTLVTFLLALAALPVLALIWGTRVTDLTELWTTLGQGVVLGTARITPRTFMVIVVVFVIGYGATRIVQGTLKTQILPKTRIDKGGQNAITSGVGYVGIFLAAVAAITAGGLDLSSLAIVAGALSVGIGFGLQNVVSNFVSGIILLIERPISEGDWIEVGGQMGYVRDISVRSTRIETFDRTDVIVPNADLVSNQVVNFTRGNLIGRVIVPVGVAYGTDTRRVEAILREVAEAHPIVAVNPAPSVIFQGFGADSLDFEIRAILKDVNYVLSVKSDMNHEIARRFAEEGIEIPFAQRDIWLRNPEVLAPGQPGPKAPPAPDAQTARAALDVGDMPGGEAGGEGDE